MVKANSVLEHLDEMFPIVRASQLRLDDEFLKHIPAGWVQARVLKTLLEKIPEGLKDFRMPKVDPSFDEEGNLVFEEGKMPGVGKTDVEWQRIFERYLPEKSSRMATNIEYDIFCGVYIKELVESGYNVARAWYEVCNESTKHGHFLESLDFKNVFAPTGSSPQGVWSDLGNTRKIITDEEGENFFTVSGSYKDSGQYFPIASMDEMCYQKYTEKVSVGLMSMDV